MDTPKRLDRGPRWGLYFLGFVGAVILVIACGYLLWSSHANSQLDKQIAEYKAAGEPIEPDDFAVTGVPDDDNMAIALREAARVNTKTQAWEAYDKMELALPLTDAEVAGLEAVVAENSAAFEGVETAMALKQVDWQIPTRSPVITVLLPDLNEQRQLAGLLSHRALLDFQKGDHAAAITGIKHVRAIGNAIGQQPTLVSSLVSLGISALATKDIYDMAPDLKIASGETAAKGEVSRQEISKLIADLLDDAPARAAHKRAMQGERMIELDTSRAISQGKISLASLGPMTGKASTGAAVAGVALKPILLGDAAIMLRQATRVITSIEASPDWPAYKINGPPAIPPEVANAPILHALASMVMPSFTRSVETYYRGMTDRRMAATTLAIRWYAIDHAGKLPQKLTDLVPKYLPAVPMDPMASNQPIKYIADPVKPILYSVGQNGTDEGGSEAVKDKRQIGNQWATADAVFPLTRRPRPPQEPQDDGVGGLSTQPSATQPSTTEPSVELPPPTTSPTP